MLGQSQGIQDKIDLNRALVAVAGEVDLLVPVQEFPDKQFFRLSFQFTVSIGLISKKEKIGI